MTFESIKEKLIKKGKLYEDPDFPAVSKSIYRTKDVASDVVWKRPKEIQNNPVFVRDQASRFDFDQGELGDCWFVAAAASLAVQDQHLLKNIIRPDGQTFEDYAGIFRFCFWRFGKWTDVIIDDRLPYSTESNEILFSRNREEPNEFWVALMEKAYAKLHGSYEDMEGGKIQDALVDFTGGISECIDLEDKSKVPKNLFETLEKTFNMNSMMGCSISKSDDDNGGQWETELDNGLYAGHAYSITGIATVKTGDAKRHKLLRLRNPWGYCEWNGLWGDKPQASPIWNMVDVKTKEKLGFQSEDNGEFWIGYDDWIANYTECQLCHLSPNALTAAVAEETGKSIWQINEHHGSWVSGLSAGGCGNAPDEDMLYDNPQYRVELEDVNTDDECDDCTLIISLMEEFKRHVDLAIGYYVFKVRRRALEKSPDERYTKGDLKYVSTGSYSFYREVTMRLKLKPWKYVIFPTSFSKNEEGNFLLRIFTEKKLDSKIIDKPVKVVPCFHSKERSIAKRPSRDWENSVAKLYDQFAGEDKEIDAYELQKLLNYVFFRGEVVVTGGVKEDEEANFDRESARSLLAMVDENKSGRICKKEFSKLTAELKVWKDGFHKYDRDKSGTIDVGELQEIFSRMGLSLSKKCLAPIVRRYAGKNQTLNFRDFILASTKVMIMYNNFARHSGGFTEETTFKMSLEDWLVETMYC
ncbi:calpain-B-like isoform X2 [Lineus longissimus]|uniref:calpain-B-like isoform X2 n=1 Tax=Lineus longissimus TaxID=88925 RepID=UPI00315D290F